MSKGSRPRPYSVSQKEFGNNYDTIFGKKDRRVEEDAHAEDEEFNKLEKNMQLKVNETCVGEDSAKTSSHC